MPPCQSADRIDLPADSPMIQIVIKPIRLGRPVQDLHYCVFRPTPTIIVFAIRLVLIYQGFGIRFNPLSENPVGPYLVNQHNWDKNQSDNRHHFERVRGGCCIVDGQTVCRVQAGD